MTAFMTLAQIAATSAERADACLVYSDMYKDATGVRPQSPILFGSVEAFDSMVDYLQRTIDQNISEERAAQKEAVARFEKRVADMQALVVNASKKDAVRIIIQADGWEEGVGFYGYEEVEYIWGLPFGSIKQFLGE